MPPSGGIFLSIFDGHYLWVKWSFSGLQVWARYFFLYLQLLDSKGASLMDKFLWVQQVAALRKNAKLD